MAVFDLDGTLVGGPSSERRFALWLLRRGVLGPRQCLAWLGFLGRHALRHGRHAPKKNKAYLAGLTVSRVAGLAERFVAEELVPRLDRAVLAELEGHRRRGERTVLLSGTLQPIADALAARLGIDRAVGSLVPTRAGRYRPRPPERHPFGREKRALAEALCREAGVTLDAVSAYGDAFDDRHLLERVGTPVAVEPARALARLAAERGWRVLRHGATLANPSPPVHASRSIRNS